MVAGLGRCWKRVNRSRADRRLELQCVVSGPGQTAGDRCWLVGLRSRQRSEVVPSISLTFGRGWLAALCTRNGLLLLVQAGLVAAVAARAAPAAAALTGPRPSRRADPRPLVLTTSTVAWRSMGAAGCAGEHPPGGIESPSWARNPWLRSHPQRLWSGADSGADLGDETAPEFYELWALAFHRRFCHESGPVSFERRGYEPECRSLRMTYRQAQSPCRDCPEAR